VIAVAETLSHPLAVAVAATLFAALIAGLGAVGRLLVMLRDDVRALGGRLDSHTSREELFHAASERERELRQVHLDQVLDRLGDRLDRGNERMARMEQRLDDLGG
jgi:hypothetical protein